jgi:transcriptional regulator with XRE-family HTH domain
MHLGERIKERRQALGITQLELASLTRITIQHMSAIEQGKRLPSISLLVRLVEKLGVSLDYLILGREENIDLIAAIKADSDMDTDVKSSLVHLVTAVRTLKKQ